MIGFRTPRDQAKALFLDRPKVMSAVDRRTLRVFTRFGGYVMKVARRSIRTAKRKSADAGEPPRSKTGLLKRNIFFHYDRFRRSVVMGPVALNQKNRDVPALLETGGTVQRRFWLKTEGRRRRGRPGRVQWFNPNTVKGHVAKAQYVHSPDAPVVTARYEPRPYMKPAYDKGRQRLDDFWRQATQAA